ncbi:MULTISPECIES: molybdopterin-dependent oxidoreductase [Shewanella]|uniref:Molybdopterin-dependent oxidoreductase n=1 Tax=Shewanella xiamenensis TaxID=332186 RepID=A0ABT6UI84_9GAMM|nr:MULTISPECIES: molybdopterin-dependent oxidoreductase [Shewanella]MCH7425060.1 molybdopterin-dependent oxidoreductase [Shewanella sp. MM_2022_3]MDI5833455.1 molybdopterin-dependent oxidoreductase [Shewanella xiamenensis]
MERRDFLKFSASVATLSSLTACNDNSVDVDLIEEIEPDEVITVAACLANCKATCPLMITTVDGVITKVSPETTTKGSEDGFDIRQQRPCARGHSAKQKIYNPDRVLRPLKRVGVRGSGQFEPISWELAFSEIAQKLKAIYEKYGSRSVFNLGGTSSGAIYSATPINNLLNVMGGYTGLFSSMSFSQVDKIMPYMYGSRPFSSIVESKFSDLYLFFGFNPMETGASGAGYGFEWQHVKGNTPVICFDPRYSDSMLGREESHYFIRPGTDAALCEAMAYHLITTDQIDKNFLKEKCYGFWAESEMQDPHNPSLTIPEVPYEECYEAHILGVKDGIPKTPEWASKITGVPSEIIIDVANRLAKAKTPYVIAGWSLQRQLNGEDNIRAVSTLALMVGAVGKRGTSNGDMPYSDFYTTNAAFFLPAVPAHPTNAKVRMSAWPRAILGGKEMTIIKDDIILPADEIDENGDGNLGSNIKCIWVRGGNHLGQQGDSFKISSELSDENNVELIINIENHMSSTAMYSDYVLPEMTWYEQTDLPFSNLQSGSMTFVIATTGIPRIGDTKSTWEICDGIARKLGIENEFSMGMTEYEVLEHAYSILKSLHPELPPTLKEMYDKKIVKFPNPCNESYESAIKHCAMYEYVNNGGILNTASGKIDIFSHKLRQLSEKNIIPDYWLGKDYINSIPKYMVVPGGFEDETQASEYPLQLVNYHAKSNVHSGYTNSSWLNEAVRRAAWINPADANGILDGDEIIIESKYGKIKVEARLTHRVMPGVISYAQGFKFTPVGNVDIGGNVNSLTTHMMTSPVAKGTGVYSNRVRIYKA